MENNIVEGELRELNLEIQNGRQLEIKTNTG